MAINDYNIAGFCVGNQMQRVVAFGPVCNLCADIGAGTSSCKALLRLDARVLRGSPRRCDFGAGFISAPCRISFSAIAEKIPKKYRSWLGAEALLVRGKPVTAL